MNEAASRSRQTVDVADVEIVAPNFKRRLSGVTSTIVQLVPLQARTLAIATLGPGLPAGLPRLALRQSSACSARRAAARSASGTPAATSR